MAKSVDRIIRFFFGLFSCEVNMINLKQFQRYCDDMQKMMKKP